MTSERVAPIAVGVVTTVVCLGLGYLGDVVMGWHWLTGASILLAVAVMSIGALAVVDRDHPPTWGGGFWSVYTEMMGRETAGGGLSEMTRPESGVNSRLLLAAAIPGFTLIILLAFALR